jgi:hypothetical protein
MPKVLLCRNAEVSPSITLTDSGSCFELIWQTGHLIDTKKYDLSRLEFICESHPAKSFPDFAVSDLGCPVVSERLRELWTANGVDNIEYFDATVVLESGNKPLGGYYAANIIGLVNCIDTQLSEFDGDWEDGVVKGIDWFDKLVLRTPEIDYGYIYRPYLFRRLIIIDHKFKKLFEETQIRGARLISPDRWDGFNGER